MASKTSGSRKLKRKSLPKFEAVAYTKIPSDGLIVFAVHYLIEHKIEITLEDIVSLCFLLFPHKFGLKRYPRWPDSAPISRHWGDVRRKRYVTANDYLGYRLTTKGTRLVRRVAKVLGVKLPKPIIKIQPIHVKKVSPPPAPTKQIQKPEIKAQPVQEKKAIPPAPVKKVRPVRVKKAVSPAPVKLAQKPEIKVQPVQEVKVTRPAPVKKVRPVRVKKVTPAPVEVKQVQKLEIKAQSVHEEKVTPPAPVKKILPVRVKKVSPAPAPVKQTITPEIKVLPVKQVEKKQPVQEEKVIQLELIKAHPVRAKKAPSTLEKKVQTVPISKPIQPAKAPSQVKETKPAKPVIIQPVKVEKAQAEPVSRETKERAGKFTRMMERSDAYIHYKKNGSKSNISEFDFRSLLLCTMESSAETLARNVELFKGYAGIHSRQDLLAFLTFCEDKFSYLLKPQNKVLRKEKK